MSIYLWDVFFVISRRVSIYLWDVFVTSRRVSIYMWDVFCHVTASVDISVGCFCHVTVSVDISVGCFCHVTASVDISVGFFLSRHGECRYICGMFFVISRLVSIYLWDVFCHVTASVDISVGCFLACHGECRYICGMFFGMSMESRRLSAQQHCCILMYSVQGYPGPTHTLLLWYFNNSNKHFHSELMLITNVPLAILNFNLF